MTVQGINGSVPRGQAMVAPPGASESDLQQGDDIATIGKLSQEFESLFLEIVLKSMRDAVPKSELFGRSNGEDIFRSMLDGEYAKQMAAQKFSSLGQSIEEQLLKAHQMGRQTEVARGQAAYEKAAGAGSSVMYSLQASP